MATLYLGAKQRFEIGECPIQLARGHLLLRRKLPLSIGHFPDGIVDLLAALGERCFGRAGAARGQILTCDEPALAAVVDFGPASYLPQHLHGGTTGDDGEDRITGSRATTEPHRSVIIY